MKPFFTRFCPVALLSAVSVMAQAPTVQNAAAAAQAQAQPPGPAAPAEDPEQKALNQALGEAGNSPVDFVRALEQHLKKFPEAKDKDKIERALVQAAIEAKDDKRVALYGERVLAANPTDMQILGKVAASILALHQDKEHAEKVYAYVHTLEQQLNQLRNQAPPDGYSVFRWQTMTSRRLADALRLQAQSLGILGKKEEAISVAKRGWDLNPTAAGAREWARWLIANDQTKEAIDRYADAFTLEDPDSNEQDRANDRKKMGELYRKLHKNTEKGLGDVILQAYDRTSAIAAERMARVRENDPNVQAKAVLDFTLPGANTDSLKMASLKGKTVVVDFWATWCQPCRIQRPMYQQVEAMYATNPNVVFLSVNTDEDKSKVPPFLASQNWGQHVYYDAGLGAMLRVASIPTTIVLNRDGQIVSRMAGFIPDRFVDMLRSRIDETLQEK
jgi:thiol-disulfide isomerase/thioredoxin